MSMILMMLLMALSSCGKLQFPPSGFETIICVDFTKRNDRDELVVVKCRCFPFDTDSNQRLGDSYDTDPEFCSRVPQVQEFEKLRGFFEDYKIFREDLNNKINNLPKKYRKRIKKRLE